MDFYFTKKRSCNDLTSFVLNMEFSGDDSRGRIFRASHFPVCVKPWSHGLKSHCFWKN